MTPFLESDPKRQATYAIGGFEYQIWQSVFAWINLKENQILVLEGAEDFDIYEENRVRTVQVKKRSGSVTLRSVVKDINNFWNHQTANRNHEVQLHFLAASPIGTETGKPFGKIPGLVCWEMCQRSEEHLTNLIDFLTKLRISDDLKLFLRSSTPKEVQELLIKRIHWDVGNQTSDHVKLSVKNTIITRAHRRGVYSGTALRIVNALVFEVLEKLSSGDNRTLWASDYVRVFENETSRQVSHEYLTVLENTVKQVLLLPKQIKGEKVSQFLPPRGGDPPIPVTEKCMRGVLVQDLVEILEAKGIVILHGGTGTGKSILAYLIGQNIGAECWWERMRGVEPSEVPIQLSHLSAQLNEQPHSVLVIDDLDLSCGYEKFDVDLRALIFGLVTSNKKIIITSQGEAPSGLFDSLALESECQILVPAFTAEEIEELTLLHGCKDASLAKSWATVIEINTRGHAQLVHARIRNLQTVGWPKVKPNDLVDASDLEPTKAEARKRLFQDAPSEGAKILAYRLSVLTFPFRKEIALALGSVPPSLDLPGDDFDLLLGPWIERVGSNYFRISPLLENAATEVWPDEKVREFRAEAAKAYCQQRTLTPMETSAALATALAAEESDSLYLLAYRCLNAPSDIFSFLAVSLSWLSFLALEEGRQIVQRDPETNNILRLLQFRIASQLNEKHTAVRVAKAWKKDIGLLENEELRELSNFTWHVDTLIRFDLPFPTKQIVESIVAFLQLNKKFGVEVPETRLPKEFAHEKAFVTEGKLLSEVFFMQVQVSRTRDDRGVTELLEALAGLPEELRNQLTRLFREDEWATEMLISKVWLKEAEESKPDFGHCLKVLETISEYGVKWRIEPLVYHSFRAISMIYDEYLSDPDRAITILDEAIAKVGQTNNYIEDQRAKVLFNRKEDSQAIQIWESILPTWKTGTTPAYSCRFAGMAAAEEGDWGKSIGFFELGRECAERFDHKVLATGFKGDSAFANWKQGSRKEALASFSEVLDDFKDLPDPDSNLHSYILQKRIGHTIAWMSLDLQQDDSSTLTELPAGCMSNPEVTEDVRNYPLQPNVYLWMLLESIEGQLGLSLGIADRLKTESETADSPIIVLKVGMAELDRVFQEADFADLISHFKRVSIAYMASKKAFESDLTPEEILGLDVSFESISGQKEVQGSLYALLIAALFIMSSRGIWDEPTLDKWTEDCKRENLLTPFIEQLLLEARNVQGLSDPEAREALLKGSSYELRICVANKLSCEDENPNYILFAQVLVFDLLSRSNWWGVVADDFESMVVSRWLAIIEDQSFSLLSPRLTVPAIEKVCNITEKGLAKTAKVMITAESAVSISIPKEIMERLKSLARINDE